MLISRFPERSSLALEPRSNRELKLSHWLSSEYMTFFILYVILFAVTEFSPVMTDEKFCPEDEL